MADDPAMSGPERQREVYLAGAGGRRPTIGTDPAALEARAREAMSEPAFAYVAASAGSEDTKRENRAALDRWRIVPRMLRDVSRRELSVQLLGRRLPAPLLLGPVGVLELAHSDADLAVARAARQTGVPMVFSNQASVAMERCARAMGDSPRWFQLYWSTRDELVESFLARAAACGCEAIVLTLDTTMLGWRTRDLDLAYLPFLRGKGIAQYTSDPVFRSLLDEEAGQESPTPRPSLETVKTAAQMVSNYPGSLWESVVGGEARSAVQRFVDIYSRPSLRWDELSWLRERTALPILLKGILDADDARRAVEAGMDGVIVSNHGGRQVDGAIGAIDALPPVVDAVAGRVPVLMDSGIRGGADAFKALALGATAVLLGRPYVYALALAGEQGVRDLVANVVAELDLTMGLAGCASVDEIDADRVARRPG